MRHHHIYINYFLKRGRSFVYAWQGIVSLFGNEPNARIHLCVALLVVAAGFFFNISASEWCLVTLCIGGVFMAEAFNTAIEKLCDKVSPQTDSLIKIAKDVAAGAVLLFVFAAVTVGLIVFCQKSSFFSVENLEKLLEQAPISLKFGALFNI